MLTIFSRSTIGEGVLNRKENGSLSRKEICRQTVRVGGGGISMYIFPGPAGGICTSLTGAGSEIRSTAGNVFRGRELNTPKSLELQAAGIPDPP